MALSTTGCAYPRVVSYYDEECQIMARRMELDAAKMSVVESCGGDACLANLVVGATVAATSALISGTIVRVGNVVYWQERNKKCRRGEPYRSEPAPATARSAS